MQKQEQGKQNGIIITREVVREKSEEGKLLNQYMKIKKIGQGPYSKIKLMVDINTCKEYAMKKFNMFILKKKSRLGARSSGQTKYTSEADEVYKEIEIMKRLNHPNVIKLHEIIYDDEEEKVYLIIDYCKYGDIIIWDSKKSVFIRKWSYREIAKYFKEIAAGLEYLHSLDIVHRDIKPQNIQIDENYTAKLIDFGRSVQLKTPGQRLAGSEGTYQFMAPEMLSEKIAGGYDGKLCDIWSLGVTLFCSVFCYLPFSDPIPLALFDKIEKCQYKLPQKLSSEQAKFFPLIKSMIEVDWEKRPPLKEVRTALESIEKQLQKEEKGKNT